MVRNDPFKFLFCSLYFSNFFDSSVAKKTKKCKHSRAGPELLHCRTNPDGAGGFVILRFPSSRTAQAELLYYKSTGALLYTYKKTNPRKNRQ